MAMKMVDWISAESFDVWFEFYFIAR